MLLAESSVYPIFNKLARYSLGWHHQLSQSFRLCWRIKKKTILPASPIAPHYIRVIMRIQVPPFLPWTNTVNAENPSNWEEANKNLQIFPYWEAPELACSNSRQVVQLSHPISTQSTWTCDRNLARAQIQHQVLCSCSGWNTLHARQVKLQAGAGFGQQPQSWAKLRMLLGSLTLQPFCCWYLLCKPIQDT